MQCIPYPMLANICKESHLTHRLLDNFRVAITKCPVDDEARLPALDVGA